MPLPAELNSACHSVKEQLLYDSTRGIGGTAAKPFMTLSEYIVFLQNSDFSFVLDPGKVYVALNHGAYRAWAWQ